MLAILTFPPLLTWTPPARNLRARVYRGPKDQWVVLIRDTVYDGLKPKYVSQRDFDLLADAEAWAKQETGQAPKVSI